MHRIKIVSKTLIKSAHLLTYNTFKVLVTFLRTEPKCDAMLLI
uniref:Uncharacterized protein n=1 Tax=Anguilla anguilla TaxID=7936 RepID=A0A0E9S409_ANGAN